MYNYIIKGGRLVSVDQSVTEPCDIGITGGRITKIGRIDDPRDRRCQVIDATGCIVSPGLIDLHMHLYPLSMIGVYPEAANFPSGVTTAVDCGSAGASNYRNYRQAFHSSRVRTFAFLNVCSTGLATRSFHENVDPKCFDRAGMKELLRQYYGDDLLGLKIRQGAEIVGDMGLEPLKAAIGLGEELGVPVMVHVSNTPSTMDELTALLRPGDILTHAYTATGGKSILNEQGKVSETTWAGRERGVIFDVANANAHFNFKVARQAIAEGFLPDTISTDLTNMGLFRRPNAFNLLHIMSKYLNMGLTLEQVFERVTTAPARVIGHPELGVLKEDNLADIAVFRQEEHEIEYGDSREIMRGGTMLRTMLTMREGELVYRDQTF